MTEKRQGPRLDERDFDAIEAAVMETERGRWFLAEFAKRNRLGETRLLLDAITRLEQNVGGPRPPEELDAIRAALGGIAEELRRAAADLGGGDNLSAGLDGFVQSVSTVVSAVSDIHDAAERVSELAWRLRERGASPSLCSELERAAADISTASAFRQVTSSRARALAEAVRAIGAAIAGLPPGWAVVGVAAPLRAEPAGEEAARASDSGGRDRPQPLPAPAQVLDLAHDPAPGRIEHGRVEERAPASEALPMAFASLAALDELDFRERLKLFT